MRAMEDNFSLNLVFEKYPSSFFLVKPIITDNCCNDFTYIYVNPAFGLFVGKSVQELIGHTFCEVFGTVGEPFWLNLFYETASKKMVQYVENSTTILKRKLTVEAFYVEPDMCGCIIRDYVPSMDEYEVFYSNVLQNKAYSDALTGAYNKFHLQANENQFSGKDVGIAYFELSDLEGINAMQGHGNGDKMLCEFVQMLTNYYYKASVYRLGGDEFLVITRTMPEQIFINSCNSFKRTLDTNGNAAMGFQFYHHVADIWKAIDECSALMLEHKNIMKKSF
jgi:diguanylate cyclase (GGDEF)-like protein